MRFDITEVAAAFPEFRLAVIVCADLEIAPDRSPALADFIAACEAEARERWGGTELSAIPGIAAWRQAYRQFGIKKTSYRSSVERLVKNVLAGGAISRDQRLRRRLQRRLARSMCCRPAPTISTSVARRRSPSAIRGRATAFSTWARWTKPDGRSPIRRSRARSSMPTREKVLCRRWNWRQDARSVIRAGNAPRRRDAAGQRRGRCRRGGGGAGCAAFARVRRLAPPSTLLDAANAPRARTRRCRAELLSMLAPEHA